MVVKTTMMDNNPEIFIRKTCELVDLSDRFQLKSRCYEKQFFNIYSARITQARKCLEKVAEKKWGKKAGRLMNLNGNLGQTHVVIGTIYKKQELKPSILLEVSKQYQTVVQPVRTHFVSEKDELILEDETQRVALKGKLEADNVVTGCVVAVLGNLLASGMFQVEDYCWPEFQIENISKPQLDDDRYVAIVSGWDLSSTDNSPFPLQLFVDWLTGWIGDSKSQEENSKISHLIIAGNSIHSEHATNEKDDIAIDLKTVLECDDVLDELSESIDVTLMPGEFDPTNHTLPQQPMHRCLFPKASQHSTFRSATNPILLNISNRLMIGTAGQPIVDIQRYSTLNDPLEILEKTLEWGHMAPTAPDTLPCYPYVDRDPFLLDEWPDIYFAGNQPQFQTKLKTFESGHVARLICVPAFAKTQCCAVVNLKTLECHSVSFNLFQPSVES